MKWDRVGYAKYASGVSEVRLEQARGLVLRVAHPLAVWEEMPLEEAWGRVLSADLTALEDVPAFSHARVDGFALRAAETTSASPAHPVTLPVIGLLGAGEPAPMRLHPGTAAVVGTGAPLPRGADAVVAMEEVETLPAGDMRRVRQVRLTRPVRPGASVAGQGERHRAGDLLLPRGTPLDAGLLDRLAAQGYRVVPVLRRPRVGLLPTGDELVPWSEDPGPNQVRASNMVALAAQVRQGGGIPVSLGPVPDDQALIRSRVQDAIKAEGVDFLITTGGASHGPFDFTVSALRDLGEVVFWGLDLRPGQGTAFTVVEGVPVLSLPGGSGAARLLFEALARPALLRMAGHRHVLRARVPVRVPGAGAEKNTTHPRLLLACVALEQKEAVAWVAEVPSKPISGCAGRFQALVFLEKDTSGRGQAEMLDWPETETWQHKESGRDQR